MLEIIAYLLVMILFGLSNTLIHYGHSNNHKHLTIIGVLGVFIALIMFVAAFNHARNLQKAADSIMDTSDIPIDITTCLDRNGQDIPCDQLLQ